jgi:putative hydrolase of the HAD superfamily/pyrimidine and pyridine-specific 5'-nucleotidase
MDVLLFSTTASYVVLSTKFKGKNKVESAERALLKSLQDGTSRDSQERICTVSEDNVPTLNGNLRSEMRLQNLWHRATYILVRHAVANGDDVVFVQRRSMQKDYCPGKLDPTPGGVVGFGESCFLNAEREIEEEMGINVQEGNLQKNRIDRLFTFSYQDEKVKVWGEFYEAVYNGPFDDLKIQKEEVDEVFSMTLDELKHQIEVDQDSFMPDCCHAMRLYFQRKSDVKVQRRLLKGYSSGDLDRYDLRPKPSVVFFDCDDTLYFDGWKTANHLTKNIEKWCVEKIGLQPGQAYKLYKQYGTALRGLLAEGHLEDTEEAIDRFLEEVHDLPISELLMPDPELRKMLLKMDPSIPKYIFTASVSHHAERCLKALGIEDLFEDVIIDVKHCKLQTKHSRQSFDEAMKIAGVDDPEQCLFLDDSVTNIKAARGIGWRSVLVGKVGRDCGNPISSDHAELEIERIHEIATVLPELFDGMN